LTEGALFVNHFCDLLNFAIAVADIGVIAIENAKLHKVMMQRLAALKEDVVGWYELLAFS
jgi:hypothetical protein